MNKEKIIKALGNVAGLKRDEIQLEISEREEHGDYSSNIAMTLFSKTQGSKVKVQPSSKLQVSSYKNPKGLAEKIIDELEKDKELMELVEKIEVAGPGFINFWLSKEILLQELQKVVKEVENYGSRNLGKDKRVVIDYSSPNIAKRFSIGHLRSTVIGQALYNLYSFLGYEVIGDNHLGDWGTQFGMILAQIDKKGLNPEELNLDDLERVYVEFNKEMEEKPELRDLARKWFKKLEEKDKRARELWQALVDTSLAEFEKIYELLNVSFDVQYGESFYEDKMPDVIKKLKDRGLLKKSKGAEVVEIDDTVPAMIVKSDGATTYLTRDLAAIKFRVEKWDPEKIIYEVGAEQSLHFRQVFAVAEMLSWAKSRELVHVPHGLIRFKKGKMSTRKGLTVKLKDILDESIQRARKIIEDSGTGRGLSKEDKKKVAEAVGIGAVKYFDLMHQPKSDIVFDWEKMFVLEGNSGPYLQYTAARTNSVLSKAKNVEFDFQSASEIRLNKEELAVLRSLIHFQEIIKDAAENYSPNLLCNYLFELAKDFNAFYNKHGILEQRTKDKEKSQLRVSLTSATGQVLKNGLCLLGIKVPRRM